MICKDSKFVFIDFEFNKSNQRHLNIVSSAYRTTEGHREAIWLHRSDETQESFMEKMISFHEEGYIFVAYAVTAEARCFETMITRFNWDIRVWDFKWIDLYLEWRQLLNHNERFTTGKHLVGGSIVNIPRASRNYREKTDEKKRKAEYGYGAACYKLLGEKIDTARKNEVRDIIIKGDNLEDHMEEILEYNDSDIDYLPRLLFKILDIYEEILDPRDYQGQVEIAIFKRGDYAARTAQMEAIGYPIDYESTKSFSDSVPAILFQLQNEINELFPDIKPFNLVMKEGKFTFSEIRTKEWIAKSEYRNNWRLTKTGKYSLSLDAFSDHFSARHDFPKDCFGSQIKRYLTFKRNLNGFLPPKKGATNFWDAVGDDQRVRSFFGIYGSQSSRSQPKATSFLFLKSAWMRSLCVPKQGRACTGIDYKSEEFLLGALLGDDQAMIEAYYSGDPYSWFAKATGSMPEDGNKTTHPKIRDAFKSTVLALQYMMGNAALAKKLTADTGTKWTKFKAAKQSKMFNRTFSDFFRYREDFIEDGQGTYQVSWDGWILFPDNPNPLSIGNWPIQTAGAVIMREAVRLAQDEGLDVIFTLHDALYIEHDSNDYTAPKKLAECMKKAFQMVMETDRTIGLDIDCWSLDYIGKFKEIQTKYKEAGVDCSVKGKYIDPRGVKEYEKFKIYFTNELDLV